MEKKMKKQFLLASAFLVAFLLFTVLVRSIDVQAIGPCGSNVGFATLNGAVHRATGVNSMLYTVTDWLGLVPIGVAFGYGILGLVQWIRRKSILKVDRSVLALGGFYIAVILIYFIFEMVTVNYRPILIEGRLEASYPSSTTMLVLCVIPAMMMELSTRIKQKHVARLTMIALGLFVAFMVIGRFLSGVHWITDILGGAILSGALVSAFAAVAKL